MFLGITPFGMFHTVISLVAVAAGGAALIRDGRITPRNRIGMLYVLMTVATCITGFFIFHHGGFGKPHALGIITLVVLAMAGVAGYTSWMGRFSPHVETIAYSLTLFFHMIPAFTETATRVPPAAPLAAGPDAPGLQATIGVAFLVFLVGAVVQVRRLRRTCTP